MARRRSKTTRAQRLKANAKVRSAQIAAMAAGQLDTINPTKISRGTLNRLSRPQLETLAQNVGNTIADAQQASQKYASAHKFYEVPPVTVTKKDRMFAQRKPPTDQQIASAPARQAKLLRQQQRKINAAKEKISSEQNFNMQLWDGKTVAKKLQEWQMAGGNHENQIHDADQHSSSDIAHLQRYANVLKNPNVVKQLSDSELRREIIARGNDLKLAEDLTKGDEPRIGNKDDDYVTRRLSAAFGGSAVKAWHGLSKRERYSLLNQTSFLNRIEFYSVYNDENHEYESWDHDNIESAKKERNDIMSFLRNAKNIAGAKIE